MTNNGTINGVTANNGVFTTTDTVFGDVTQNGGGVVNARGFIVNDVTVNSGDFNVTGALGGINNVTNSGRINVVGGPVTVSGTVTNHGGMTAAGTVNTGNIAHRQRPAFNFGAMNNSGRIGLGAACRERSRRRAAAWSAGSTLDMQNGAAGDTMIVQGGVSGTNTVAVDLDLTTTNAGFADVLDVNGSSTAT